MKKIKVVSLFLMFLMLAACSSNKDGKQTQQSNVIYFMPIVDTGSYWSVLIDAAKEKADELGYELVVRVASNTEAQKNERRLGFLTEAVSRNAVGIAVAPADPDMFDRKIAEIYKSGIPVVTFDADVMTVANRATYVGTNNYEAGMTLGRIGAEYLKGQGVTKGSISTVATSVTQTTMVQRLEGVKKGFNEVMGNDAANFTWLETIADDDQAAISKRGVEAQIVAVADLAIIFGMGSEGPDTGVMEALRSSGKFHNEIPHFGFDYTPTWLNGVDQGLLVGVVDQDARRIGHEVIIALDKVIKGGSVPANVIIDVNWVLAKDLQEYAKRTKGVS